jgi:OmpA-OmpF porin, OOP family
MKKLILFLLIVAFAATVNAQTSDQKWGIGGGTGAYGTLKNGGIGVMPELYLSRYLSPKFDLMLKGEMGLWRTGLKSNIDLANPFLNLRYKLSDESKNFRPYIYAGPGFLADNGSSGLNFDFGIGGKYYFKPNIAFYGKGGYINGIQVKGLTENLWKLTLGLEYDFGKVNDADKDGVSDTKDKCPDTPLGVAVDANGCPVDSDGDGVADYIDDCPTIAGLTSLKGCPDKDKDGIADKDDACPDIAGIASMKGCPDADGDGIADKDDKCPNTPKGWKVDASGCPLDQDKDGVADAEDNCPTVAGPKENKGCPIEEKTEKEIKEKAAKEITTQKMNVEPVYFDYDKSTYITVDKPKIDHLVTLLKENKDYNVKITGYADSKGSEEYNLNLSKKRISSVVNTITTGGIKKTRISLQEPMGETNPAATNNTDEGRALNRRVEFELIKIK